MRVIPYSHAPTSSPLSRYDTSLIVHNFGPDDYVIAAINLYLDIVNLFLYLLEFLRMLQGGDN